MTPKQIQPEIFKYLPPLNLQTGPWIAGGAALTWFQGNTVTSDIDIFFQDEDQWEAFRLAFIENYRYTQQVNSDFESLYLCDKPISISSDFGYSVVSETENALTMQIKGTQIQLIKKFSKSITDVFDSFDFDVCKFATDGESFHPFDRALDDLSKKILHSEKFTPSLLSRVMKYTTYGFIPDRHTLELIKINSSQFDVYGDPYGTI